MDIKTSLKQNPEAWIYVFMPKVWAQKCGTIVAKKRALQVRELARVASLLSMDGAELVSYIDTCFKAKFGYSAQEGVRRIIAGEKVTAVSGVSGVDDSNWVDETAGEIDPNTGLPMSTIRAAMRVMDNKARVGSTERLADQGVPSSWLTLDVPQLGVNQSVIDRATADMTRAWTVQDPSTGVVYTMTIDRESGVPNAVYRADNGKQVSFFANGTWQSSASSGMQKFNEVFDYISVGLGKVSEILSSIFAMVLQSMALSQAQSGNLTMYQQLQNIQNQNPGILNSQISTMQSDSYVFGGSGTAQSGGGDLATLALIGLGIYLIAKN